MAAGGISQKSFSATNCASDSEMVTSKLSHEKLSETAFRPLLCLEFFSDPNILNILRKHVGHPAALFF